MNIKALITVVVISALSVSAMSGEVKSKDYLLKLEGGGKIQAAHVAVATRRGFPSVNPNVVHLPSIAPNCWHSTFIHKGVLKQVTFNCKGSKVVLTMQTR